MNATLLVIDMQIFYYKSYARESMDQATEHINFAINRFRRNDKKIIWTQHEDKKDGIVKGTKDFEIIDILRPNNPFIMKVISIKPPCKLNFVLIRINNTKELYHIYNKKSSFLNNFFLSFFIQFDYYNL